MIINNLISAVSIALYTEFGENYTIYAESVEQGLDEPCFFIRCLNSIFTRKIREQSFMENLFCIQFFPNDKLNPTGECVDVAERLMLSLEYVTLDNNPVRSTKMNYEIIDGILNFFLNFNFFVHKTQNKNLTKMQNLEKITLEAHYDRRKN